MSVIAETWLWYPEVQALLDRAYRYYVEMYTATGIAPNRFVVTEREYRLLVVSRVDDGTALRLFGMRVCRPERIAWYQNNRHMEHFKQLQPIRLSDPFPPPLISFEICRTKRPTTRQREVMCPCGEVIWDLSTCRWVDGVSMAERHTRWHEAFARDFIGMSQPMQSDPLPPLDDIDEGLQCCGHTYLTFAEFMAHRREHGEG